MVSLAFPVDWLNVGGAIHHAQPDHFPTRWKHLIAQESRRSHAKGLEHLLIEKVGQLF
ncbi:hypothetical protein [Methylocapsa aurea]|uniref:hypothetical protein n=1 Tax=Methylocapsa aurea TaxID=663610 RepID=UPI0012EBBE63|nr:hypothetical protein [Methylocapsa aurea]